MLNEKKPSVPDEKDHFYTFLGNFVLAVKGIVLVS